MTEMFFEEYPEFFSDDDDFYPTTEEYWTFDGVLLNHYAWNIETLDGRDGLPPLRGENLVVGQIPGRTWVPKVVDQRVLTLAMFVRGCDPQGLVFSNQRARFKENLRRLKRLFGQPGLKEVVRREATLEGSPLVLTAMAERAGTMEPAAQGPTAAKIVVDLVMPDPYWYGPVLTETATNQSDPSGITFPITFPVNFGPGGAPGTMSVDNEGDAATAPQFRISGPLVKPTILHVESQKTLTLDVELLAGESVTLSALDRTVLLNGTASRYYWLTQQSRWFLFEPGVNTLRFFAREGSGSVTVAYRSAYN